MTSSSPDIESRPTGPYMNEDGDWWVAVEDVASQDEAETIVRGCMYGNALEFIEVETASLSSHELGDGNCPGVGDCEFPQPCTRNVPAYHFRETDE